MQVLKVALPIDPQLDEITSAFFETKRVVIIAEPGAGKTTRVPLALGKALSQQGYPGEVWVTVPRRIAAQLAAEYCAAELGETVGDSVGYTVRFEDRSSKKTKIRFVTEGILERRLASPRGSQGIAAVILDEFHERHCATDFLFALLTEEQKSRPDLLLGIMSASLASEPLKLQWQPCQVIQSPGRSFPIDIEHDDQDRDLELPKRVSIGIKKALKIINDGDVLVFLPGMAEIRATEQLCRSWAVDSGIQVLPLHGELSKKDQELALSNQGPRRVILSTNIAESSITLPRVRAVVDSGLSRTSHLGHGGTGNRLELKLISQASAIQRSGRAGRTAPGYALRLYSKRDFEQSPPYDKAEILRSDLSAIRLQLLVLGLDPRGMPWLEAPHLGDWETVEKQLSWLGAQDANGKISSIGKAMQKAPISPRAARAAIQLASYGNIEEAAILAALLSERDPLRDERRNDLRVDDSDLYARAQEILEENAMYPGAQAPRLFDRNRWFTLRKVIESTQRWLAQLSFDELNINPPLLDSESAFRFSILVAFQDCVVAERNSSSNDYLLCDGRPAKKAKESRCQPSRLAVATEIGFHDRTGKSASLRSLNKIEEEWLLELNNEFIAEESEFTHEGGLGRVFHTSRIKYGSIVIDESKTMASPSGAVADYLWEVISKDLERTILGRPAIDALLVRLDLLFKHYPHLKETFQNPIEIIGHIIREALTQVCTIDEYEKLPIETLIQSSIPSEIRSKLSLELPESIRLSTDKKLEVHYERGKTPWVASRLQDFFGTKTLPPLLSGKLQITIQLLAPNMRAVQITQDLAGFWERHYSDVKKELRRRYPKHSWPDDGATAEPPPPRRHFRS